MARSPTLVRRRRRYPPFSSIGFCLRGEVYFETNHKLLTALANPSSSLQHVKFICHLLPAPARCRCPSTNSAALTAQPALTATQVAHQAHPEPGVGGAAAGPRQEQAAEACGGHQATFIPSPFQNGEGEFYILLTSQR